MTTGLLVLAAVLIFLFVVFASLTAIYYHQFEFCRTYPSPWCWDDWKCMDGSNANAGWKNLNTVCDPKNPSPQCPCEWDWYSPYNGGANMCTNPT